MILPVDHGVTFGTMPGLEDPVRVLEEMGVHNFDAALVNHGVGERAKGLFRGRNAPARILNADAFYEDGDRVSHAWISWPERAAVKGYDAVKVLLLWDLPASERRDNVEMIARLIRDAERWEMPVIVEPVTARPVSEAERVSLMNAAVRIAYELGPDALKIPHPGNLDILESWCRTFQVPIVLLGGSLSGSESSLIAQVRDAMRAGARGIAIGRNIWQRPREQGIKILQDLAAAVHAKT